VVQTATPSLETHCDIIAHNEAIAHHLHNVGEGNWNELSVNTIFQTYKDVAVKTTSAGFEDTTKWGATAPIKGYMFFDWEKQETGPNTNNYVGGDLGDKDHMEYCEISADGKSYTVWQNDGFQAPYKVTKQFVDDYNGQGGGLKTGVLSQAYFVRLN